VQRRIAEWADGDAIAAHIAYGNDYFCTRDAAKKAGPTSILSARNREWLLREYGARVIAPGDLAAILADAKNAGPSGPAL
jgi:hypothetical protein